MIHIIMIKFQYLIELDYPVVTNKDRKS